MSSKKKSPAKRSAPRGASDVKKALVDTLLALLAAESPRGVSVRKLAETAGVNHGLVHRHFGTKEQLLRAAFAEVAGDVFAAEGATPSSYFDALRARPELAIVLARVCLDGPRDLLPLAAPPPERLEEVVAPVRALLDLLGPKNADPYVLNALGTAALLGWFVFRPLLEEGYHLPADADEKVAALLAWLPRK